MKISILTEVRIYFYNNDYYVDGSFYKIIERYANKFNDISLFSRVISSNNDKISGFKKIELNNLKIYNIGSIFNFLIKKMNNDYKKIFIESDLIILRIPSLVFLKVMNIIKKHHKKYMCEIMGCAFDAYWNHGIIGKILAIPMHLFTKKIVMKANYCLYVTNSYLQSKYPTKAYYINASNVNIDIPKNVKDYSNIDKKNINLFTSAALNVKYKGQQYVIKAISKLKKQNININYYLAGKGDSKYLSSIAKKYGVESNVHFLGMLSKEDLEKAMINSDIYVQPSLQEGLPRSLIEAMNLGLVCLGTNTSGIPELLEDKCVFKRKSTSSFIKCFNYILNDNFDEMSKRNKDESKKYYSKILDKKRNDFYDYIVKDIK